jgi:tRNA-binding EMAP/Myf-like protein
VESSGMLLAAEAAGTLGIITVDRNVASGALVK